MHRRTYATGALTRRQFLLTASGALAGAMLPRRPATGPLIADHTAVARYTEIPQVYIDAVKTMWADIPGESHSFG